MSRTSLSVTFVLGVTMLVCLWSATPAMAEWKLQWAEEFSGNSLNRSRWQVEVMCWAGNDERQCYTDRPQNVYVKDGALYLKAIKENYRGVPVSQGCTNNNENSCTWTKPSTSGRIRSKYGVDASWKYGRFEVRAKLPKGDFFWPAIWMLPTDQVYGGWPSSGEIDIMEARGQDPTKSSSAIHFGDPVPNNKHYGSNAVEHGVDLTNDFHTYSAEWDENAIKFYVDNRLKWTTSLARSFGTRYKKNGSPFDQKFHFVMNLAVAGKFFNTAKYGTFNIDRDAKTWTQPALIVDYARVYKWEDAKPTPAPTPTPAPKPAPAPVPVAPAPAPKPSPSPAPTCFKETEVATEDAHVDSTRSTLAYGADKILLLRKTGTKSREVYLKFPLNGHTDVPTKATISLFGSGEAADGTIKIKASTASTAWTEAALTFDNRPKDCTTCYSTTTSVGQNPAWRELDVLGIVRAAISARQTFVAINLSLPEDGYASFNSKDAGTGLPKLNLEFGKCS